MAAFKVVQKIASVNGNATSGSIALKSGYLRVTPAGGDAFVEVGTDPTATDDSSIFVPVDTPTVFKESVIFKMSFFISIEEPNLFNFSKLHSLVNKHNDL